MIRLNAEVELEKLEDKLSRKILNYDGSLMMVEVHFKKGGIGTPHAHDIYEQISYILKGRFEVTVGEETKVLKQGDTFYAGHNVTHGVIALEDSIILDVFTPIREDFLQ